MFLKYGNNTAQQCYRISKTHTNWQGFVNLISSLGHLSNLNVGMPVLHASGNMETDHLRVQLLKEVTFFFYLDSNNYF